MHAWHPYDIKFALYSEAEPKKMHRNFGNVTVHSADNMVKRAMGRCVTVETRRSLESIARHCNIYATNARSLRILKLTVGVDGLRCNHSVRVDAISIQ